MKDTNLIVELYTLNINGVAGSFEEDGQQKDGSDIDSLKLLGISVSLGGLIN